MNNKALIAMSGGVDSSVAAYLMKSKGYDCIGATMKLFHNEDIGISGRKTCCSFDDTQDARSVAAKLGIPYYVFNFTEDFAHQVIERFVASYENGITPNPCIDCNRYLKFERLYRRAEEIGCDTVVTGHYARIEKQGDRYILKKALDKTKDQSYVTKAACTYGVSVRRYQKRRCPNNRKRAGLFELGQAGQSGYMLCSRW